jgi:hypothetical protein
MTNPRRAFNNVWAVWDGSGRKQRTRRRRRAIICSWMNSRDKVKYCIGFGYGLNGLRIEMIRKRGKKGKKGERVQSIGTEFIVPA